MMATYILWGIMTLFVSTLWFITKAAWDQNTPDKNQCFWVCWAGTLIIQILLFIAVELFRSTPVLPTEKVKITISSNIPKDSIELVISSKRETHSTDLS